MTSEEGQQAAPDEYFTFAGDINAGTVQAIMATLSFASNKEPQPHVHVLFQSNGGVISDGIALYNYFRSLPLDLTLYNVGGVLSIATIVYLGAARRKVSTHATFMVHRSVVNAVGVTAGRLKVATKSLDLDDRRTENILRAHLTLTDDIWRDHEHYDVTFSAAEAIENGIAHEVAEFSPPRGAKLYHITG